MDTIHTHTAYSKLPSGIHRITDDLTRQVCILDTEQRLISRTPGIIAIVYDDSINWEVHRDVTQALQESLLGRSMRLCSIYPSDSRLVQEAVDEGDISLSVNTPLKKPAENLLIDAALSGRLPVLVSIDLTAPKYPLADLGAVDQVWIVDGCRKEKQFIRDYSAARKKSLAPEPHKKMSKAKLNALVKKVQDGNCQYARYDLRCELIARLGGDAPPKPGKYGPGLSGDASMPSLAHRNSRISSRSAHDAGIDHSFLVKMNGALAAVITEPYGALETGIGAKGVKAADLVAQYRKEGLHIAQINNFPSTWVDFAQLLIVWPVFPVPVSASSMPAASKNGYAAYKKKPRGYFGDWIADHGMVFLANNAADPARWKLKITPVAGISACGMPLVDIG